MSIANPEKSAKAAKRRTHKVITKTLVSAAIVLVLLILVLVFMVVGTNGV